MKKHISDEDFAELASICHDWQVSKIHQAACISSMIDDFGCDADEAVDLLNTFRTARGVVDGTAAEIHSGSQCNVPWPRIDGEACMVWFMIVGGATVAAVAAMGA